MRPWFAERAWKSSNIEGSSDNVFSYPSPQTFTHTHTHRMSKGSSFPVISLNFDPLMFECLDPYLISGLNLNFFQSLPGGISKCFSYLYGHANLRCCMFLLGCRKARLKRRNEVVVEVVWVKVRDMMRLASRTVYILDLFWHDVNMGVEMVEDSLNAAWKHHSKFQCQVADGRQTGEPAGNCQSFLVLAWSKNDSPICCCQHFGITICQREVHSFDGRNRAPETYGSRTQ